MSLPQSTLDILRSIANDANTSNDSHRDNLQRALNNDDKAQLSQLLDQSDDNDIQWLLDIAKGALNSPVTYALITMALMNKKD